MFSAIFNGLKNLAKLYNSTLMKYPLRTSMITASGIYGTGDYVSQIFVEGKFMNDKENPFTPDWERFLKMCTVGLIWSGPFGYFWFWKFNPLYIRFLLRWFPKLVGKWTTTKRVIASLILDNFLFVWPVQGLKCFLTQLLSTRFDFGETLKRTRSLLMPSVKGYFAFFPFLRLLIYTAIPFSFRGLVNSIGGGIYSGVDSMIQHSYEEK